MATTDEDGDQSQRLSHRGVQFLSTVLADPFPDWFSLLSAPLRSLVNKHPVACLVATCLVTAALWLRYQRNRRLPPGPWAWPVVGHLSYLLTSPHTRLSHLRDVYGDVYQLQCGGKRVVVVSSLEAILQGLVELGDDVSGRPDFESFSALYKTSRHQGVCTGDMDEGCRVKKQFLNVVVDAYCSDASRIEDKVSAEIVDTVNQISEIREPFDPLPVLHMACLNVALNLTFSQRFDPSGRMAHAIFKTYECRSGMFGFNAADFLPWLKAFTTDDHHIHVREQTERQMDCNRRLVNLHKDSYDPSSLRDFADQLLLYVESGEDCGLLRKDDLDYLLLDTAGYGFQATAVTLTWMLGYMALNQEVQSQVHKEIDVVVGRDRLPCLEDQPYLPLTEAVIYEVQRLASVHPFLLPHRTVKDTLIQGYEIPGDTVVLFNIWGLHHDPRYWPHPSRFDPYRYSSSVRLLKPLERRLARDLTVNNKRVVGTARFLNEDKVLEIPDHFLPYGAGARQCPGESLADVQIFLFFTAIMHQLRVLPASPNMTLEGVFEHLLQPKPFSIIVEERD